MIKLFYHNRKGFSLVELILAIALFGLFATALIGLLVNSYGSDFQAEEREKANLYVQEGLEAVWSVRRQAWNLLTNGDHGLDKSSGYWQFSGSPDLLEEKYTRTLTINDACRNSGGDIIDCSVGGALVDLHTKKATVVVTYPAITGIINRLALSAYLTTWQSKDFIQTDWSGGGGQTIWSSANRYSSDDGNLNVLNVGQVTLAGSSGGGCGSKIWYFDNADDYTLSDLAKIEVANGFAQLVAGLGPSTSGASVNAGFTSRLTPWTFGRWGTTNPSGARASSGGNPGGYAKITFPYTRNVVAGGYFQQSFTVSAQTIASATLNLDWRISQYSRLADSFILYAFVDTAPGAPTLGQEVWSSGNQTGAVPWTRVTGIDVSSKITGPGTYYLKIVAYVDYPSSNARYTVGFDNVLLNWSGYSGASYPTDRPSVNPTLPYSVSEIDAWSAFTEVATKNGGEIYYQLSDGAIWYWWNGSGWFPANTGLGTTDYNLASEVNANIASFPITSGQILFKAFLASSGSQQVQLDEIKISCAQYYDWPFDTPSDYTYNPTEIDVADGFAQLVGDSFCTGIPDACDTFSDQASCEGQSDCAWTAGIGSCQNNGSCSALSRNQCSTCSTGGCYRSGNRCRGTLNCSAYDQTSCSSCSQCRWVISGGSCSGSSDACDTFSDQASCEGQISCLWSGLYPVSSSIQSTSPYNTPNVWEYTAFVENATKNGGEIYYQLSINDVPDRWYWWDSSSSQVNKWVIAGSGNYNLASEINANIAIFPTSTSQIMFRAFLIGDGTQPIQLNNVRIGWGESVDSSGYAPFGYLISSAFNMGEAAAPSIIKWTEVIPACSPACSIKLQVRTAPDIGGSPGSWSNWYGATGSGTYFTNPAGSLISSDLNFNQWLQYRVELNGDGIATPILEEVKINYLP
ncbi:MAG: type II secretion system protein [Patescibacteria group bacterium]|jgi:prepilin-type N-terminal cleavage/methylation domain-containing protein